MKIGYDAKRLFFNGSGLGNYSRSTVEMVARQRPDCAIALFSPKEGNTQGFVLPPNAETHTPENIFCHGPLRSLWRTYRMGRDVQQAGCDLFHGLSHELPTDIRRSGVPSVVTMHDLIFVRYPELYKPADRALYVHKYKRSCEIADRIIAISRQTRDDLVEFWHIDPEKIDIVYQGCNPIFYDPIDEAAIETVRQRYGLPQGPFILSVGTVEPRKNLMLTVRAMVEGSIDLPLVACGRWTPYKEQIEAYASEHGVGERLHFRNNIRFEDLPAIYRMATVSVYASIFEGFGIPILEALNCGTPVITSAGGVFPETGGDAALYVDPQSVGEMRNALARVIGSESLRREMIERGHRYALNFREEALFPSLWASYERTLNR